jgi:hypothetical protein
MATTLDTLLVRIEADSVQLRRELALAERQVKGTSNKMSNVFKGMARHAKLLAIAVPAAAAFAGAALVRLAADAEEMQSKSSVVFGDYVKDIRAWAAETADATQRSRFELELMASSVQDTFVPLGFARGEAAEMSKALTELAVDVASFNNANDVETMRMFQSALVGNVESVRRFGIVISETSVKAELLRMGIKGGSQAATEQQKVQARLNLIVAGSTDALGDAARTSDSFTNQMKGLQAASKDLGTVLGQVLIPVATKMVAKVREGIDVWAELFKVMGILDRTPEENVEHLTEKLATANEVLKILLEDPHSNNLADEIKVAREEATRLRTELEATIEFMGAPTKKDPAKPASTGGGAEPIGAKTQERIDALKLEADEVARLRDAYSISVMEGEKVAAQIDRENEIRGTGLELKSAEAGALDLILLKKQADAEATEKLIEVHEDYIEQLLKSAEADKAQMEKVDTLKREADEVTRITRAYAISREEGEKVEAQIERENELRALGIDLKSKEAEQLDILLEKKQKEQQSTREAKKAYEEQERAIKQLETAMMDGLLNSVEALANGYGDLRSVAVAALMDILKALIQVNTASSAGGGGGFGGLIGSAFGGLFGSAGFFGSQGVNGTGALTPAAFGGGVVPFASGGNFSGGQPMLVGEKGPELIVPTSGGRVFNAAETRSKGGGGSTIIQQISIHPDVSQAARQQVMAMLPLINRSASDAVQRERSRDPRFFRGNA